MAIDWENLVAFPTNVIDVLYERLRLVDASITVVKRGIRRMDPNLSVGLYPESWQPVGDSTEFPVLGGGTVSSTATLNEYFIQIHTLTSGMDQAKSQRNHSLLARTIRDVVEFDQPLRVALSALPGVTVNGKTEFFKKIEALSQAYFPLDNASTTFINVGALRCKITTEIEIG